MDVKSFRRIVGIAIVCYAVWIGVALYLQISNARSSVEERRIANQSQRAISEALRDFVEVKGYYPAALDQLAIDKQITRNFRYWTNANGGYSLMWEGKHGFQSSVFTSHSNTASKLPGGIAR